VKTQAMPTMASLAGGYLRRKCACGQHTIAGGECNECGKESLSLQRATRASELGTQNSGAVPPIVHEVLRSSGQPLDAATRAFFEPRFAHDFSRVRVHTDARAVESARAVNALAYTVGPDVAFAASQYSPATSRGRQLLGHELAHVVQQGNSSGSLSGRSVPGDLMEREADKAASGSTEGQELNLTGPIPVLMRKDDADGPPDEGQVPPTAPLAPPKENLPGLPAEEKPLPAGTDAKGKECPETVLLQDQKAIPAYNKKMFDAGFKTYFGLVSNMKVGPKDNYEACITEVLKVEENTCGDKGNFADYDPCAPKKYCMKVNDACGGDVLTDTKFACSGTTFVDLHKTHREASMLEGSGKTECKVKCLQRYGCGGKEIGRFYITRNFKAGEYNDGKQKVHITTGSIEKAAATK
jgi:hypothetical protein